MSEKPDFKKVGKSVLGSELTLKECDILSNIMSSRKLKDGEVLVDESGEEHTLFILIEGQLKIFSESGGQMKHVYTMKEGEVAGTRAFVDRTPRKATLEAEGEVLVYSMEPDSFESLLEAHPGIVYKVMRSIFRITHTNLLRMNQERDQLSNYINKTHGRY